MNYMKLKNMYIFLLNKGISGERCLKYLAINFAETWLLYSLLNTKN